MKKAGKISLVLSLVISGLAGFSQSDSLGLPGDNLDLEAVLSIFKNSSSVEDFEKKLNSASEKVNNLDLNGDGQVDYLRVIESGKDNFRSIVIQDQVSKSESQDVAVIEIEKKGDQTAHVQIVGDETLYGKDYILEPRNQKENLAGDVDDDAYAGSSKKGNQNTSVSSNNNSNAGSNVTIVNVWGWPAVTYMYSPGYAYWVSPWYWGYYPGWYNPWTPYGYYYYRRAWFGYSYGFYGYRAHYYAFPHVHHYYYGHRVASGYVQKTAPAYHSRQSNMNGTNRTHYNRAEGGANVGRGSQNHNSQRTNPGQNRASRANGGEQRMNKSNSGHNRSNSSDQRSNGGANRSSSQPRGGGGGHQGGGGHSGGGGHHR